MRKHRHPGKYKSRTKKGRVIFKKRPVHNVSKPKEGFFAPKTPEETRYHLLIRDVDRMFDRRDADKVGILDWNKARKLQKKIKRTMRDVGRNLKKDPKSAREGMDYVNTLNDRYRRLIKIRPR